jgi:uncharacterized protein
MKKFWIQVVVLMLVIFGAMYINTHPEILQSLMLNPPTSNTPTTTTSSRLIKIKQTVMRVEVADTPQLRSKGLGGRASLPVDSGLLFIFEQSDVYRFWMKGMQFPIDFIFIRNGRIVDILASAPPPAAGTPDNKLPIYQPSIPIDQVLEVNAGFARSHGFAVGDTVQLVNQGTLTQ